MLAKIASAALRRVRPRLAASVLVAALVPAAGQAQDRFPVRGTVVDAAGAPVADAAVEVVGGFRATAARADGRFELQLPDGDWRIRVSRVGFRADTVAVAVRGAPPEPRTVRLAAAPLELRGISVRAPRTPALAQSVTTETVRQVPPLGEPDVFRAVVLLPGVSQPNDLKGRIHLAGGSSDETGVRLDGHPLQDPFHLLGLFGAFNTAALERADVLIHHLPPALDGRLSGVVDLTTRRPASRPSGEAVAGLLTAGATASVPGLPGGVDLLASGRVTYLDRVAAHFQTGLPRLGFGDGTLRLGRSWGGGWRAEAVGFATRDHFAEGDRAALPGYRPLTWGETLGGVRIARTGAAWDLSARASWNRASLHMDERGAGGSNFARGERDWISAAAEAGTTAEGWRAGGGVAIDHRRVQQRWVAEELADEIFSPNTPARYEGAQTQTTMALFGGGAVELGERWTASAGARLGRAGDRAYLGPRVTVDFRPTGALRLEAAFNRRHQFDAQLEEPIEGSITPPLFLLQRPRTADVAALSADWAPRLPGAADGELRAQLFHKAYPDRVRLDESADGDDGFPRFGRVAGRSFGASVGAKVSLGEALVQGSYTLQRVQEREGNDWAPTAWDAPHAVSLFGSAPLGRGWVLNTVYQGHSGRATTPVLARIFEPDTRFGGSTFLLPRYLYGERNSVRVPPYHRFDLGTRRGWRARGAEWTLSLQVLNVLHRENPVDYDWTDYFTAVGEGEAAPRKAGRSGLPILPSIGMEVRW